MKFITNESSSIKMFKKKGKILVSNDTKKNRKKILK